MSITSAAENSSQAVSPPLTAGISGMKLDGLLAALAGADADHVVDAGNEDLSVAELAGARRLHDRVDGSIDQRLGQSDLDLELGQEIDLVFAAPIGLGVSLLTPETFHLA